MKSPVISLLLSFACAAAALQCTKKAAPVEYVVDFLSGEVSLAGPGEPVRANVGDIIREGMTISTGERSFARVSFGENVLKIYEMTELAFPSLSRDPVSGAEQTGMRMEKGTILSSVALKLAKGDSHSVSSDTMIAAVRGTEYLYSVDGILGVVACYRGAMSVLRAGSDEEIILKAGEMVYVRKGKKMKAETIPANFRYKDFTYGRDPASPDAAGIGKGRERVPAAAQKRSGGAGTRAAGTEMTGSANNAVTAPAAKKAGAAAGSTALIAAKKEAQGAGGERAVASERTVRKEAAAGKGKESGTVTAEKKQASVETQKAAAAAARQPQPGALLEKPRVDVPELK